MLAEVIAFALVMSAFEFVLVSMLTPRLRLRMLGNEAAKMCFHLGMLLINLWVHWGTVVGTMSATLSFITSMAVIWLACKVFGHLEAGRYYHVGWIKYSVSEVK